MLKMKVLDEMQSKLLWSVIQMHSGQKLQAAHMDQGIVGYVYLVFELLSMIHFETGITGLQGHIIGYAHDFANKVEFDYLSIVLLFS